MSDISIRNIKELRHYIKTCKEIRAVVRFGVNDRWTKISKQAALEVIEGADDHQTPDDYEMYGSEFGSYSTDTGILYFG